MYLTGVSAWYILLDTDSTEMTIAMSNRGKQAYSAIRQVPGACRQAVSRRIAGGCAYDGRKPIVAQCLKRSSKAAIVGCEAMIVAEIGRGASTSNPTRA